MSNVLTEIKKLLGMQIQLEQMTLDNGTVVEAEIFEAGQPVFIVNGEDRVALPVGEYILDNGMILVVATEGEIAEIKEPAPTEEEAPAVEVEVEQAAQPAPTAKKVIESTVKESHFSKEDVDALKSEIENLKTELASMKRVETFEEKEDVDALKAEIESLKTELAKQTEVKEVVELSAEPLKHNPEAKQNVEKILFSQSREMTTFDRVMSKIAN